MAQPAFTRASPLLPVVLGLAFIAFRHSAAETMSTGDHWKDTTATISSVTSRCGYIPPGKDRYRTADEQPCLLMEEAQKGHPAGGEVIGLITAEFDYLSPADQQVHHGSLKYGYPYFAALAGAKDGDLLPIYVSSADPLKYDSASDEQTKARFPGRSIANSAR